jgi:hypothetical protein
MALTEETKERLTALVTKYMPREAQEELIQCCEEIGSVLAANTLFCTIAAIQECSLEADNKASVAEEKAEWVANEIQNLVEAHSYHQETEINPWLKQIAEETVSTQEMILGLMKHLGVSLEDVVKAVKANAASANEPEKYNATVGNDYATVNRKSTSGNGARNPTWSLGDSAGYVKNRTRVAVVEGGRCSRGSEETTTNDRKPNLKTF